jgi:hypothetical protein
VLDEWHTLRFSGVRYARHQEPGGRPMDRLELELTLEEHPGDPMPYWPEEPHAGDAWNASRRPRWVCLLGTEPDPAEDD